MLRYTFTSSKGNLIKSKSRIFLPQQQLPVFNTKSKDNLSISLFTLGVGLGLSILVDL
jgi:hypothetical protein